MACACFAPATAVAIPRRVVVNPRRAAGGLKMQSPIRAAIDSKVNTDMSSYTGASDCTRKPAMRDSIPGLGDELKTSIDKFVTDHKIVVFMKGTKDAPRCGFSNTVCQVMKSMAVPFETVNILESDELRSGMKVYSEWPTFPQVYIDGEFFGGCDIVTDSFKDGSLKETVEKALSS